MTTSRLTHRVRLLVPLTCTAGGRRGTFLPLRRLPRPGSPLHTVPRQPFWCQCQCQSQFSRLSSITGMRSMPPGAIQPRPILVTSNSNEIWAHSAGLCPSLYGHEIGSGGSVRQRARGGLSVTDCWGKSHNISHFTSSIPRSLLTTQFCTDKSYAPLKDLFNLSQGLVCQIKPKRWYQGKRVNAQDIKFFHFMSCWSKKCGWHC